MGSTPSHRELIARVRDPHVCTDALHRELADALEASEARHQGEPSDAQVEAAAKAMHVDWWGPQAERVRRGLRAALNVAEHDE